MKNAFLLAFLLVAAGAAAQVEPAATGGNGLPINGGLQYSARYSQAAFLYGNQVPGGNQMDSMLSADLIYTHPSLRRPFNLQYGGGYMWPLSGPSLGTGFFQHLLLSQGFVQRPWSLTASEGFSYTPEAPLLGFSGVPGTGEPVGGSGATPAPGQSILTMDTRVVSNRADLRLDYSVGRATTFSVTGASELLRYPDSNGLDSDGVDIHGGVMRRLNARNTLGAIYSYARYEYSASPYSGGIAGNFVANSASFSFHRRWTRRLTTELAAGPQWTAGSNSTLVPPTTTATASAALNYQVRSVWASLSYARGMNGGAGYLPGATVDSVQGNVSRPFGRSLLLTLMGAYMRTTALQQGGGGTDARFGGIDASRRFGPYISLFGSYTAVDQTSRLPSSLPQSNLLNQPYQVISFGLSYSPREKRLKR